MLKLIVERINYVKCKTISYNIETVETPGFQGVK